MNGFLVLNKNREQGTRLAGLETRKGAHQDHLAFTDGPRLLKGTGWLGVQASCNIGRDLEPVDPASP